MRRAKIAKLMNRAGITFLLSHLSRWGGVLCLNYHRIGNGDESIFDRGIWSATAEAFDAQVRFLKLHFDIINPNELPAVVASHTGRHVCITFDDGYLDNFEIAFPILKSHGVRATFFVTTSFLDRRSLAWWDEIAWMVRSSPRRQLGLRQWVPAPIEFSEPDREQAVRTLLRMFKSLPSDRTCAFLEDLAIASGTGRFNTAESTSPWMTWHMLREMQAAGMTIGGHTVNHPILANMDRAGQWCEIAECGQRLKAELGEPMRYFSYPVGNSNAFNSITRNCLREAGVQFAFSYYGGFRNFTTWDEYDIRRVAVEPYITEDLFRAIVNLPHVFT